MAHNGKLGITLRKILAENIRGYRRRKNLSQEKLAEICGLHRTYVGSVERAERNVTLSTLEAFSNALNIPASELLTKKEPEVKKKTIEESQRYVTKISQAGVSIYDPVEIGDPDLWIPTPELEILLNKGLKDMPLHGMALRTRSKIVKESICHILGYPAPKSFKKTHPKFPGQQFDIYIQKSDNVQIWNEDVVATRRYVLIRVSSEDIIERAKVISGDRLALLDTTGTLTQKYQARIIPDQETAELVTPTDTDHLLPLQTSGDLG